MSKTLTDPEALDYARRIATLRFFPRRDPAARAQIAGLIQDLAQSAEEAEAIVQAITSSSDEWRGPASFAEMARRAIESCRAGHKISPLEACAGCPFTAGPLNARQRTYAIQYAEFNCELPGPRGSESPCVHLPTARLLQAEDRADVRAAAAIRKLSAAERRKLRSEAEQVYRRYQAANASSPAGHEPFLEANLQAAMLALMRRNQRSEAQA